MMTGENTDGVDGELEIDDCRLGRCDVDLANRNSMLGERV